MYLNLALLMIIYRVDVLARDVADNRLLSSILASHKVLEQVVRLAPSRSTFLTSTKTVVLI